MSTKITLLMRDRMVAKAQELAGIPAAREEIEQKKIANGRAILVALAGGQEAWAAMDVLQARMLLLHEKVPKKYRGKAPSLFSGCRHGTAVTLGAHRVSITVEVGESHRYYWVPEKAEDAQLEATHPLAEEYFELEGEVKRLNAKADEIRISVNAALVAANFNRTKLLKAWPEAIELLPELDKAEVTALTVPVATLNTLIGLPSGGGQ